MKTFKMTILMYFFSQNRNKEVHALLERLVFNLVLNFERLCFVYIFTPVLSHGSCA